MPRPLPDVQQIFHRSLFLSRSMEPEKILPRLHGSSPLCEKVGSVRFIALLWYLLPSLCVDLLRTFLSASSDGAITLTPPVLDFVSPFLYAECVSTDIVGATPTALTLHLLHCAPFPFVPTAYPLRSPVPALLCFQFD